MFIAAYIHSCESWLSNVEILVFEDYVRITV